MPKAPLTRPPDAPARVRRGYFECRYGQLHVHHSMPPGGGFEEGTPLLCVHDSQGTGRAFAGLMSLLGRDRSAYAPDLPGCGESDPPPGKVGAPEYAAALGDFLTAMRLKRLDVLGLNMGAAVAVELALDRTAQVRRVVWISSPAAAATQQALAPRERLTRLTQPLMVLRPQEEGQATVRPAPEVTAAARVVDLPQQTAEVLAGRAPNAVDILREFLRG